MRRRLLAVISLIVVANTGAWARLDDPPAPIVLGPGDVIDITVRNFPELDRTVTIGIDGRIAFPDVGQLLAAGKTPEALAQDLQTLLLKDRRDVEVVIVVKERHSWVVRALIGERAAVPSLWAGARFVDLVVAAGGLGGPPSAFNGRIVRGPDRAVLPVDVQQAMLHPESEANIQLQPNDLVILSRLESMESQVSILGQVVKPGVYALREGDTAYSLLTQAGGPTDGAGLGDAYIIRGSDLIPIDLKTLWRDGRPDASAAMILRAKDVLYVPEIKRRYGVFGKISRPGYFPYPESGGLTLLGALAAAGWSATGGGIGGDMRRVTVTRTKGDRITVLRFNVEDIVRYGGPSADISIQSDDMVFVPGPRRQFGLQDVLALASAAYLILRASGR